MFKPLLKKNFTAMFFYLISIAVFYGESSHIDNPSFGNSTRFRIFSDSNIKTELQQIDEDDNSSQTKNPQYQKSTHAQNASVKKITSSQIAEKQSTNIQDVLESEGLLIMTTGGTGASSNLSVNGYAGFCIKVYIDGILSNNSTTGEFDWNSIDVSSIETIEIQDIPSLSETEFAGCVIRITTKNGGNKLTAQASVASYKENLFDTWNAHIRYDKEIEKFNYNLGVNVSFAENEFERTKELKTQRYNFSNSGNINFAWNTKLDDKKNLYGSNIFFYNKIKADRNSDLNTGMQKDITTRNNINFAYKNKSLKSDTSLFYNFSNVKYVNNYLTNFIDNTSFNKIAITENLFWFCNFFASAESEFVADNKNAYRFIEKIGASKNFSFGNFSVEPQLIILLWQSNEFGSAVLPRLTINYNGFTLAGFREFILPTFNQLYWPDSAYYSGNTSLKPEQGWSGFLGFKRNDFPLWAQYKISYYGNKIRWLTENGKTTSKNLGDAFYNVVTVGLDFCMFNDVLKIELDTTYTGAKLIPNYKQIMWVPEWQAHAGIRISFWRLLFNADYSFVSYRWADNQNTVFYPAYNLLNACITFSIKENFCTYLKANNLLDERVVYHDNYFMQSRKFTVGVKFNK